LAEEGSLSSEAEDAAGNLPQHYRADEIFSKNSKIEKH
jgi:hypothetical protein